MYKIFLIDDHPVFLNGMQNILTDMGYCVTGTATSVGNINDFFGQKIPHIVFVDIRINNESEAGVSIAKSLLKKYPELKIIAFSADDREHIIKQLIDIGVQGYISKNAAAKDYKVVINSVMDNKFHYLMHTKFHSQDLTNYINAKQISTYIPLFTETQMVLIRLCATNLSYEDISKEMNRTVGSIEQMRKKVFEIANVKTRQELVRFSIKIGLLS